MKSVSQVVLDLIRSSKQVATGICEHALKFTACLKKLLTIKTKKDADDLMTLVREGEDLHLARGTGTCQDSQLQEIIEP